MEPHSADDPYAAHKFALSEVTNHTPRRRDEYAPAKNSASALRETSRRFRQTRRAAQRVPLVVWRTECEEIGTTS